MSNKLLALSFGLALLALTACGDDKKPKAKTEGGDKPAAGGEKAAGDKAPAAAGPKPVGGAYDKAKGTGSAKITVKFAGAKVPADAFYKMSSSDSCASHDGKMRLEKSEVVGGNVPHCFVWAAKGPHEGMTGFDISAKKSMTQKDCVYDPHVIGLMVGQTISVKNDDPTTHNVHTHPAKNKEANISQGTGKSDDLTFAKAEEAIGVGCDVHSWMSAHVFVLKHPFCGTTDRTGGSTTITGLYPGKYTFKVWHEAWAKTGKEATVEVEVTDGGTAEATVELGK